MADENLIKISDAFQDSDIKVLFMKAIAIRSLMVNSVIFSEYTPSVAYDEAIKLSSEGEKLVSKIQNRIKDISYTEIKLALFLTLSSSHLLIDLSSSDLDKLQQLMSQEISEKRVLLPWIYETILYNKFYEKFPDNPVELSYEETFDLLKDTPQGVFQIGKFLSGPFGILTSSVERELEPVLHAALWHCSDPACNSLHNVEFASGKSKVEQAVIYLFNSELVVNYDFVDIHEKLLGKCSDEWYDEMNLSRLPFLLANSFSEMELQGILRVMIELFSKEIRYMFPRDAKHSIKLSGTAEDISRGLDKSQCLQLLLLMSDAKIIESVEVAIDKGIVKIPATESRNPVLSFNKQAWFNVSLQCSRFGVRTVTRDNLSLIKLKNLIRELYLEEHELLDLSWKLRHIDGRNLFEKVDNYLYSESPKDIIKNLVFSSSRNIIKCFEFLRYGSFNIPSPHEEEHMIEKILWKLGFDIGLYPNYQSLFWERLEKLRSVSKKQSAYTENDKEEIRSAAVNFFVSLEEILDYSLSFTTWALYSDHFGNTEFKCNFDESRRFMAEKLNGFKLGSQTQLVLNPERKNTLFPLINGFTALAERSKEIVEQRSGLIRSLGEMPNFYGRTKINLFPFQHKLLVLDLRIDDFNKITNSLNKITYTLERNQVSNIRNRLEHQRQEYEFPSPEEIETACVAISEVVTEMEELGICPLIYLYSGSEVDQYGRAVVKLADYRGRELKIRRDSQYEKCAMPGFRVPQIVVPAMHIGDSTEFMRFKFVETSDFVDMWKNYPKRQSSGTYIGATEVIEESTST